MIRFAASLFARRKNSFASARGKKVKQYSVPRLLELASKIGTKNLEGVQCKITAFSSFIRAEGSKMKSSKKISKLIEQKFYV